ncbi:hypothetical protein VE03_09434 [Pseudogymnoascus sp. 23342-1-I1]|nr:hypothetical protein VE03_09434 [Pseudogymnoascus sp. 23342-1-I1]
MSSNAPHRSSRPKGSSKRVAKGELRRSNASNKQSVSSISVQAPLSPRMDLYTNQSTGAEGSQATIGARYGYGHYDMRQGATRLFTDASGHGNYTSGQYVVQPSIRVPDNGYHTCQQYAAQVAAGIVSFGIDASPALQQTLTNQHGSLGARERVYSTTEEGAQFLGVSRNQDLGVWDETLQYEPCVEFGYENDGLSGDLSGIGSQFDSQVEYCKYL